MSFSKKFSLEELCYDNNGLIPAIAQDWLDGSILMLAWMSKESIEKTLRTKEVHYWSRSRSEIWKKGGACHTGERSCFFNEINYQEIDKQEKKSLPFSNQCTELFNTLKGRSTSPKEESYTNYLLRKGSNTILKKIGEETSEFIMACKDNDKYSISNEAADIIYHLQVALLHKGVEWRDVLKVLESRRK